MDKREQIQKLQDLGLTYLEAKEQVMTNEAIKAAEEAASNAEKLRNEAQEKLGDEYSKAAEAAASEAEKLKAEVQALTGSAKESLGDAASEAGDKAEAGSEKLEDAIAEEEVKAREIWELFLDGLREFFRSMGKHDIQIFFKDDLKFQMKASVALIILVLLLIFFHGPFILLILIVAMITGQVFGATFQLKGPGKVEGFNNFMQSSANFLRSLFGRKTD